MPSTALTAEERMRENMGYAIDKLVNLFCLPLEYGFEVNSQKFVVSEAIDQGWGWEAMDEDGACISQAFGFNSPLEAQQDAIAWVRQREEEQEAEYEENRRQCDRQLMNDFRREE